MKDANFITDENKKVDDSISERFGIISASGIGGLGTIEKNSVVCQSRGPRRISPFLFHHH